MGKGAISKKRGPPSVRSRAARRATSPGIDLDKSLKDVRPPTESVDHRPSILAIHHGAGVSKKSKRARNLSSKARKRQENGQDRALAIMERTEQKVSKSKAQARSIQSRRKDWEDINKEAPQGANKFGGLDDKEGHSDESEFDDEMGDEAQQVGEGNLEQPQTAQVNAASVPLPEADDDLDDGIL